jgi:hypothetical protein
MAPAVLDDRILNPRRSLSPGLDPRPLAAKGEGGGVTARGLFCWISIRFGAPARGEAA